MRRRFDVAAHTHHPAGSSGAACTACHMPQHTYMGVHVRHDHGFRIPRPDLHAADGTSDSCTDCHAGRSPDWAARAITAWLGHAPEKGRQQAILAAARDDPTAARAASRDDTLAPIARATLLAGLGADPQDAAVLRAAASSPDELIRFGAAHAQGQAAVQAGRVLLGDPLAAVRVTAARPLAGDPAAGGALREWQAAEHVADDRPESHSNLGALYAGTGAARDAEWEFATALRLEPDFVPALVDLGDLARARGDEHAAETYLRRAVAADPANATAWYALGLSLVRQKRQGEALDALSRARGLGPE